MYEYSFVRTRGKDKSPRKRTKKADRSLTVSTVSGYQYKNVPALRISGLWLEDYGLIQGIKYPSTVKTESLSFKNQKTNSPLVS